MKIVGLGIFLIIMGLALVVAPNLAAYLNTDSAFFDFAKMLSDHPELITPFGYALIMAGITILLFLVIDSRRINTAFVVQKAYENDYGDVGALHYSRNIMWGKEELVYDNIVSQKRHDESNIEIEKERMSRFYRGIPASKRLAFLGISPMPTIVLAGYIVGNSGRKVSYYHWNRKKSKAVKLRSCGGKAHLNDDGNSGGMTNNYAICISTSYQIDKSTVEKDFVNHSIKYFKLNELGPDSIKTINDLNRVADAVRDIISGLPSGVSVNLLLSCSAELCFAIGQRLNSPVLPTIRVYNLGKDDSGNNHWNWSIAINER